MTINKDEVILKLKAEVATTAKYLADVTKQRDELLEALKMFVDATSSKGENPRFTTINTQLHASAMEVAEKLINTLKI